MKREKPITWKEAAKKGAQKHSEGEQMLKDSRSKSKTSQRALAKAIGVCQHHISEMENGKRPIGKQMARRFAEFFNTDYRLFL